VRTRPHVLLVAPQRRDLDAIARLELERRFRISTLGRDLDLEPAVEPQRLLEQALRLRPDGVAGTKDRSALLAAIVAERLGLPGPSPGAVLACQLKPAARERQRRLMPAATPAFALVGDSPPLPYPFFVKPVVGRLSQAARRVDDWDGFRGLERGPAAYARSVEEMACLAGASVEPLDALLAEELLVGRELTLEGYVHRGRVTVIGATDSVHYPGTRSFERFEYPGALSAERLAELESMARRLVEAHGLDDSFFNLELVLPEPAPLAGDVADGAKILELNPRLASQFARLVELCHGCSTYEALFALACGGDPAWDTSQPPQGVAVSYVLRTFEDALVEAIPAPEPDLELLVRAGLPLSQQGPNDAASFRLAIFTEHGDTREQAVARCVKRASRLRGAFRLRPL
jgi:hypothetical protein